MVALERVPSLGASVPRMPSLRAELVVAAAMVVAAETVWSERLAMVACLVPEATVVMEPMAEMVAVRRLMWRTVADTPKVARVAMEVIEDAVAMELSAPRQANRAPEAMAGMVATVAMAATLP